MPNGHTRQCCGSRGAVQRCELPKLDPYFVVWVPPVPVQASTCEVKHEGTSRRRLKPDTQLSMRLRQFVVYRLPGEGPIHSAGTEPNKSLHCAPLLPKEVGNTRVHLGRNELESTMCGRTGGDSRFVIPHRKWSLKFLQTSHTFTR